jgi:hypothetical protein
MKATACRGFSVFPAAFLWANPPLILHPAFTLLPGACRHEFQ